ncbi:hypothetical protein L6164_001307 [Bauhinia variegata]|uniref:Uncharacterized protein n=1 Tax=Bauhinia variegata TaxID=167791 RepID=A0ACB9Q980_BAUVA|nr:hypothetical protein L6164_001307 [Bauhinia variegata]
MGAEFSAHDAEQSSTDTTNKMPSTNTTTSKSNNCNLVQSQVPEPKLQHQEVGRSMEEEISVNSVQYSDEELLSSIDPVHRSSREWLDRRRALKTRLFGARGRFRSEFPGFSYSDFKNLLAFSIHRVPRSLDINKPVWEEVVEELRLIVKEYEVSSQISTSKQHNHVPGSAALIPHGAYHNEGEQQLTGLINNQSGSVAGFGNGSYIVIRDCNIYYDKKQKAN